MTTMYDRFTALHSTDDLFLMPNPWDIGSAVRLEALGFPALATTSSGHAATLGRSDMEVTRDEVVEHTAALAGAIDVPLNVDAERCFADTPEGVATTVALLVEAGAAGCSIEDYNPASDAIDPIEVAVERVAAAAEAAHGPDRKLVLTARAENKLHGITALDDTLARLVAFREAGADVVYAPGLVDLDEIRTVVETVGVPVNVLRRPGGPSLPDLAAAGVRRLSIGGAFAFRAYAAMEEAAAELLEARHAG